MKTHWWNNYRPTVIWGAFVGACVVMLLIAALLVADSLVRVSV